MSGVTLAAPAKQVRLVGFSCEQKLAARTCWFAEVDARHLSEGHGTECRVITENVWVCFKFQHGDAEWTGTVNGPWMYSNVSGYIRVHVAAIYSRVPGQVPVAGSQVRATARVAVFDVDLLLEVFEQQVAEHVLLSVAGVRECGRSEVVDDERVDSAIAQHEGDLQGVALEEQTRDEEEAVAHTRFCWADC